MNLRKSETRNILESLLDETSREIKAQLDALTALRKEGMFPHPNKLATATASLTAALVKACAEMRQQENHQQKVFDAMDPDERNALLIHHLDTLDDEWRDKYRARLDELGGEVGILG